MIKSQVYSVSLAYRHNVVDAKVHDKREQFYIGLTIDTLHGHDLYCVYLIHLL